MKAEKTTPVWIVSEDDTVRVTELGKLIDTGKEAIEGRTLLLPPTAGGLTKGMLTTDGYDESQKDNYDVADQWKNKESVQLRLRDWNVEEDDTRIEEMRLIRSIPFPTSEEDDDAEVKTWDWYEIANEGGRSSKKPVLWKVHVDDVICRAKEIVKELPLPQELKDAVEIAAIFHDHGKRRKLFQTVLGNRDYPKILWAKSGKHSIRVKEQYRHEFGSLLDLQHNRELKPEDFARFEALKELKELVLHLIATHHGRGRPHFPDDEAFDPNPEHSTKAATDIACEVPRRYARLQRKYGRWGLAYLESLLRAADWAASANPSQFYMEGQP